MNRFAPPCVARTYAVRSVFAQVVAELGAADSSTYSKGP